MSELSGGDKNISRRSFLRMTAGTVAAAALLRPTAVQAEGKKMEHDVSGPSTPNLEPVMKAGVEIIGSRGPLKSKEDLLAFQRKLEKQTDSLIRQSYPDLSGQPKNQYEKWRLLAPPNERILQVYITSRLWKKFNQEAEAGGLDALGWIQTNIDEMNHLIKENPIKADLETRLKRIVVVDDSLAEDEKKYPHPALVDVDASWFINFDYRGEVHPQTKKYESSGFLRKIQKDGKPVVVDGGLIHEWTHHLYNWPDEYTQDLHDKNPESKIPDFNVIGGLENNSAWAGACLQRIKRKNIRGYYTDERGLGVHKSKDKSQEAEAVWSEIPENSSLTLTYPNGEPLQVPLAIYRSRSKSANYYKDKYLQKTQVAASSENPVKLDFRLFTAEAFDKMIIPVLNISVELPNNRFVHLPIGAFNLAKWAGQENPVFNIQIMDPNATPEKKQTMYYVPEDDLAQFEQKNVLLAKMLIPGTSIYCMWTH